jgi:hypothetical protein
MSDRGPILERIFERTARALGGGGLHPMQVLSAVEEAASASIRDGVVANQVTISLHPADYRRYQAAFGDLRLEVDGLLDAIEQRAGATRIGDRIVRFARSAQVDEGQVAVTARFADTALRPAGQVPGVTRRIVRHRGAAIVLADGTRVTLTHTPFSIGRGPGNDLVLPSMAVSRQHARITHEGEGFVIEDLGSRNGVTSGGARMARMTLTPGVPVKVGDVEIRLEVAG